MFLFGLSILYVGLLFLERFFGIDWKEYTAGITFLCLVIFLSCLIESMFFAGSVFFVNFLLEYNKLLKM